MNCELICKEIITDSFILTGKIKNNEILLNLKNDILNNNDEKLNFKTNVQGLFTGFEFFLNNTNFHKFIKLIENEIKLIYNKTFIISSAWGNVLKKDGEVIEHDHKGTTAFCGILYLSDGGPGTYFSDYNMSVHEEVGKFILFSPFLKHSVIQVNNNIERVTLAFNANLCRKWEDNSNFKKI